MTKRNETKELQEKVQNLENQLKRALADYQNLEKRLVLERKDWIKNANRDLILRLLPSLDTLMLAQKHVEDEGLKLSVQQFLDALKEEGVQKIETIGAHFDPKTMEVVEVEKGDPSAGSGQEKVLEEIRAGYTLNGEVLRPAQVKVGKEEIDQEEEEKAKEESQRGDYM